MLNISDEKEARMAKYTDFKSYLQCNYINELMREVGVHFKSVKEPKHAEDYFSGDKSRYECKVEKIEIEKLYCNAVGGSMIEMELYCVVDIATSDEVKTKTKDKKNTRWVTVLAQAELLNGLHKLKINHVQECNDRKSYEESDDFSQFFLQKLNIEQLEDEAEYFYQQYCYGAIFHEWTFPFGYVLSKLGLDYYEAPLPDDIFGRIYFISSNEEVYERVPYMFKKITGETERLTKKDINSGTILVNNTIRFMNDFGSESNTIAHEIIHWVKHQKFFEVVRLLNENEISLSCKVTPKMVPNSLQGLDRAMWWAEWQANALAPRILMPRGIFIDLFNRIYNEESQSPCFHTGDIMEGTLKKLGMCFGVSIYAAKARAIQLGIDTAEGAYVTVDNDYYSPLNYPVGTLDKNQTFIVDKNSANKIIESNGKVKQLVDEGLIIYTGCVFCINTPKYIRESSYPRRKYELTQYALEHANECCLIFSRSLKQEDIPLEAEVYSQYYFSKEVKLLNHIEPYYNPEFENSQFKELQVEMRKIKQEFEKQLAIEKKLPHEFKDTLKFHMKRKKISVFEMACRSNLSETTIKKYRSGEVQPNTENLMAIFIGLNLPELFCDDMLVKAGRVLNKSLKHKIYKMLIRDYADGTIKQWNDILEVAEIEKIPKK